MKRSRACLRNNLYFLNKAFKIAPLYLILSGILRILTGIRTSFMNVYFLSYVISCVETGRSLLHVLLFISISLAVVSVTYAIQAAFDNLYKPVCTEKIA